MSDPFNLILHLESKGLIFGKDFTISEEGKLILYFPTNKKISEKIVERQQRLYSSNKNENTLVSIRILLEKIATNAGNHQYFDNVLGYVGDRITCTIGNEPYLALAYLENFAEGTENKFPDLKKIPFRHYIVNEVLDEDDQIELLTNLDKYSIPPKNIQNEAIENVLMDIALSFNCDLENDLGDEIIHSIGESLMPINAFRFIDKVWTSEKVPIKKIIKMMEQRSIK